MDLDVLFCSMKQEGEGDDEAMGDDGAEPKVMTLDEWKAREDPKRVKAEFNIRKPGEGVSSDPQWKKMFVLTKKERPEEHEDEDDEQVCAMTRPDSVDLCKIFTIMGFQAAPDWLPACNCDIFT
jgi:hypothetical protein